MPKKNSYPVPVPKASLPENRFHFTMDVDGKPKELSFPKFQWLNRKITRLIMSHTKKREALKKEGKTWLLVDEVDEWIEIFSAVDPKHAEAFEALEDDQVLELSKAWLESSAPDVPEEDLPESEASSDS